MEILSGAKSENGMVLEARVAPHLEDPAVVEHVVEELRQIDRRSGVARTLAIGRLVLDRFFGGDAAAWRDRRRNKNNSIRRLANHKGCPYCRSALNEAVGIYVAVRRLPCVQTFGHIQASHVATVLSMPTARQQEMLEFAERERLSVRELRQKVVQARREYGERRGRPVAAADAHAISFVRAAIRQLEAATERAEHLDAIGPAARAEMRQLANHAAHLGSRLLQMVDTNSDLMVPQNVPKPLLRVGNT